jgi:hypothetical protein
MCKHRRDEYNLQRYNCATMNPRCLILNNKKPISRTSTGPLDEPVKHLEDPKAALQCCQRDNKLMNLTLLRCCCIYKGRA